MKCFFLLSVAIAACAANVFEDPLKGLVSRGFNESDRYFYFPGDGDNTVHLVDTQELADYTFLAAYVNDPAINKYLLYTRRVRITAQIITLGDEWSVSNSNMNFSKDTVFLVHGWLGFAGNRMNKLLTDAFLYDGDVNVIVVDWSALASKGYITAVSGIVATGRMLGQFIKWLVSLGLSYERVHLVGFSLGAHVVGNAGRETESLVKRITALDPARPEIWDSVRVVATDAKYVEVIHTSIYEGYQGRCGDADFYPNGGRLMPGCPKVAPIKEALECHHSRAYEYMASSVKYNRLLAKKCKYYWLARIDMCWGDYYPMGNSDLSKSRSGVFRVNTGSEYPFF